MLSVWYVNGEDGGELRSGFESSEGAEQYIQDLFCFGGVDEGDILQLRQNGEVVGEYTADEFGC